MFLSVIIPVYGVEKYLNQCIDSVLAQKLSDYEIILVDDGSPDRCPEICDSYAEQYPCVKVIHKTNGGLSSARNAGISAASGDYLIFMDSDDWWNEKVCVTDMLENVKSNPDAEMFLFTSLDYIEGQGYYKRVEHERLQKISTANTKAYYRALLNNGNLEVHAATKILKRSFILDNSLLFKSGIVSEDNEWILRLLRCLTTVRIINEPLYIYRAGRSGSITNSIKKKNITDLLSIIEDSIYYYEKEEHDKSLMEYELCYCSYLWFSALGLSSRLSKEECKKIKSIFNRTNIVCRFSNSKKTRLCLLLYRLFGYSVTRHVLGSYINMKSKVLMKMKKKAI